ncbi:hypothetical protein D9M69_587600 [compost metagenome]
MDKWGVITGERGKDFTQGGNRFPDGEQLAPEGIQRLLIYRAGVLNHPHLCFFQLLTEIFQEEVVAVYHHIR